jgi:electron transfer flavoprotein alpha subunit
MRIACLLEQKDGKLHSVSWECIVAGQELAAARGAQLALVLAGAGAAEAAAQLALVAADELVVLQHELLGQYTADAWKLAHEQYLRAHAAETVLLPHTYQVRDWAPRLATRFGASMVSDVVQFRDGGFVRQLFQGKLLAHSPAGELAFASLQAGAWRKERLRNGSVNVSSFSVQLESTQIRQQPEAPFREAQREVDLAAAERIVSVGRGIQDAANLPMVKELAAALGAELAASRPVCDSGWLPMERQVGSSGQTVAPKLYLALGLSGAIQHLVGMKGARVVVAINKDAEAPIFEVADYGICGDLFEITPALIAELKKQG